MIGTIISGTHRVEDLIPAFVDALSERLIEYTLSAPKGQEMISVETCSRMDDYLGGIERRMQREGYFDTDHAQYDLEWLFDALDALAPEGTYFGAHPGDGSDFGYWPVEDTY